VVVWIRPKWFPRETVKDLHVHSAGLFKILKEFKL